MLGATGCAVALGLAIADPAAAMAGWLSGFVFWSGIPVGALALLMMMRLIPGAWSTQLSAATQSMLPMLLLALLTLVPVLFGLRILYPWAADTAANGFRGLYLSTPLFSLRSIVAFVSFAVLGWLLLARPGWSTVLSAVGLIGFVLIDTTVAVDWLMSLDPEFHSSGFGLYVVSIQMTIALCVIIIAAQIGGPRSAPSGISGGLLLTALLLWSYFSFMQYFIIWSGNLPHGVAWYQRRGDGLWAMIEYAIGVLHLLPIFLLLFRPVRLNRRLLAGLCIAVLAGKMLEAVWLVVPGVEGDAIISILATGSALAGIGLIAFAGYPDACALVERVERGRVAREART